MAVIHQLDFSDIDPLWWVRVDLWQEWESADTVDRPTEDAALRAIFRQARILAGRGVLLELSPLHETAIRLEYQCRQYMPHIVDFSEYVAERMRIGRHQAMAILEEASFIFAAREIIGRPIVYDWQGIPEPRRVEIVSRRRKAA